MSMVQRRSEYARAARAKLRSLGWGFAVLALSAASDELVRRVSKAADGAVHPPTKQSLRTAARGSP